MIVDYSERSINWNTQNFSQIDLNKDTKTNTGIVFPLKSANETLNVASIVDHHNNGTKIKQSEARYCYSQDKDIIYEKARTITFVRAEEQIIKKSLAEKILLNLNDIHIDNRYFVLDEISTIPKLVWDICKKFEKLNFKPNIIVSDENIKEKKINFNQKKYTWDYPLNEFSEKNYQDIFKILKEEDPNFNYPRLQAFKKLNINEKISTLKRFTALYYDYPLDKQGIEEVCEMFSIDDMSNDELIKEYEFLLDEYKYYSVRRSNVGV